MKKFLAKKKQIALADLLTRGGILWYTENRKKGRKVLAMKLTFWSFSAVIAQRCPLRT